MIHGLTEQWYLILFLLSIVILQITEFPFLCIDALCHFISYYSPIEVNCHALLHKNHIGWCCTRRDVYLSHWIMLKIRLILFLWLFLLTITVHLFSMPFWSPPHFDFIWRLNPYFPPDWCVSSILFCLFTTWSLLSLLLRLFDLLWWPPKFFFVLSKFHYRFLSHQEFRRVHFTKSW